MGAELVDVPSALLNESLFAAAHPVPPLVDSPRFALHQDLVPVIGVGGETGDPAAVRGFGKAGGDKRACCLVIHVHTCGTVRIGARADAFASRRMDVSEIAVVHELPLLAASRLEVERTPGDECRLVRQAGEVEVRFGVKLGHPGSICKN
jgi:hypothetical protein